MSASLNSVEIIGYLGKDPEQRFTPDGSEVSGFPVATTSKWKDKKTGESKESTEWHSVSFFGKMAEICNKYLKKGSLVFVRGSLKTKKWTDKESVERYSTEVVGGELVMLGGSESAKPVGQPSEKSVKRSAGKPSAQKKSKAKPEPKETEDAGYPESQDEDDTYF